MVNTGGTRLACGISVFKMRMHQFPGTFGKGVNAVQIKIKKNYEINPQEKINHKSGQVCF